MAFPTILTAVIIIYVLGYSGMIVYDLFFKKDVSDITKKPEDEDVDIADEAGRFKPVMVSKDDRHVVQPLAEELPEDTVDPEAEAGNNGNAAETEAPSTGTGATESGKGSEEYSSVTATSPEDGDLPNRKPLSDTESKEPTEDSKDRRNVQSMDDVKPSVATEAPDKDKTISGNTDESSQNAQKDTAASTANNDSKQSAVPIPKVKVSREDNPTRLSGAVSFEQLQEDVNEYAEKGIKSKLARLKVVYDDDEAKRIVEMREALRLRDEQQKDGGKPDMPLELPSLDL